MADSVEFIPHCGVQLSGRWGRQGDPGTSEAIVWLEEVKIVDRVIDAASGTLGVRLELPNPNHRLPAGLKCKVIFPDK